MKIKFNYNEIIRNWTWTKETNWCFSWRES